MSEWFDVVECNLCDNDEVIPEYYLADGGLIQHVECKKCGWTPYSDPDE